MTEVNLPSGYTLLKYIEASGEQYVDTGFTPNNNTRMVVDFLATRVDIINNIIGSRQTTTSKAFAFSIGSNGKWRMGYYNASPETSVLADTLRHTAELDKTGLKLDGNNIYSSSSSIVSAEFTGYGSIYIGSIHASSGEYVGYVRVYSCQIYDNGTLIRDYIPCKNTDGVYGLYDGVNGVFYGSASGAGFTGLEQVQENGLPLSYTLCEYVESHGGQCIDTGFRPAYNTRIVMGVSNIGSASGFLFGVRDSSIATSTRQFSVYRTPSGLRSDYFLSNATLVPADYEKFGVLEKNANVFNFKGDSVMNGAVTNGICSNTLYLFALNDVGAMLLPSSYRLYSCQIYDNGSVVHDYIPCQDTDGVYGLYDKVDSVFFTSEGLTGEIAKKTLVISAEEFRRRLMTFAGLGDFIKSYMYFEALEDGLTIRRTGNAVEYSINGSNEWTTLSDGGYTSAVNKGDRVFFRGELIPTTSGSGYFAADKLCNLGGNVLSLFYKDDASSVSALPDYALRYMFKENSTIKSVSDNFIPVTKVGMESCLGAFQRCTSLIKGPQLPAMTLGSYCYSDMFSRCSALTTAPELPATTLNSGCYDAMFMYCWSLEKAPELPATKLSNSCYQAMFTGCFALTTAPKLPVTQLEYGCYNGMFAGCSALTTAPELPATTLNTACYYGMFEACTSLITAPELPATVLAPNCYTGMFRNCSALKTAPELPVTTLKSSCYAEMFVNCTQLTSPPVLPATELAEYCYQFMFSGCSALTTAPELPATTLAGYCYSYMFKDCTSLVYAPDLPAATLVKSCYQGMFYQSNKVRYIKMLATDISVGNGLTEWVKGVASYGTFVKSKNATWDVTGTSGIPAGWTVQTV